MKHLAIILAALLLMGSQLACCCPFTIPDIDINTPTFETGELQDKQESIPLEEAESATVELFFGAGELSVKAGEPDQLFSGHFRYNVEEWEPKVAYRNGTLTIEQGSNKGNWGWPTGNVRNKWELEFSPEIPLKMNLEIGAGEGDLDFTGLQLAELNLDIGAGDFEVRFDKPNEAEMSRFSLDVGASKLEVTGLGNAGPEQAEIAGGVGDITLDFTGAWSHSASIEVSTGVGALTLRLPDDVGVRVEVESGLSNVDVSGLRRSGDAYVNDAYGEAEIELDISVTTGIGQVSLIEVSND
jgi:hypothetical protein